MRWITLLYIALIFGNSATPAVYSSAESSWVTGLINGTLARFGMGFLQFSEGFIRKAAHFTEYTGLGILLSLSLTRYGFFEGKKRWRIVPTGFFIACIDEGIQYFTPGRDCNIKDVLLDTCGVLFGTLVCFAVTVLYTRIRRNREACRDRVDR